MGNRKYSIIDKIKNAPVVDPEDGKPVVAINPDNEWRWWADQKVFYMNDCKRYGRYMLKVEAA